jgi:hypothetical protein
MGRYRVTTPVADYSGALGDLVFTRGEAIANDEDHAAELAYAEARGYGIEPYDEPAAVEDPADEPDPDGMPRKSASTEAWRQYATGVGDLTEEQIADMSRDQLVAHYASKES